MTTIHEIAKMKNRKFLHFFVAFTFMRARVRTRERESDWFQYLIVKSVSAIRFDTDLESDR